MAISFPVAKVDFFNGLKVAACTFDLPGGLQMSRTAGGEIITADLGARLWRGTVTLADMRHADAVKVQAMLNRLTDSGASFLAYDPAHWRPAYDPTGALLGAAAVTINSLPTARELTLAGLPAGYVLTPGDYLSWNYGSSPVRRAFHQVVVGGTANGSGITPALEVVPEIRPGSAAGASVLINQPYCKAVVVPGSFKGRSSRPAISGGMQFDFIQTLR